MNLGGNVVEVLLKNKGAQIKDLGGLSLSRLDTDKRGLGTITSGEVIRKLLTAFQVAPVGGDDVSRDLEGHRVSRRQMVAFVSSGVSGYHSVGPVNVDGSGFKHGESHVEVWVQELNGVSTTLISRSQRRSKDSIESISRQILLSAYPGVLSRISSTKVKVHARFTEVHPHDVLDFEVRG